MSSFGWRWGASPPMEPSNPVGAAAPTFAGAPPARYSAGATQYAQLATAKFSSGCTPTPCSTSPAAIPGPAPIAGFTGLVSIAAGGYHGLALTADGTALA